MDHTEELTKTRALIIKYNEPFDPNCDRFLPLTSPVLTKTGKPKVHQPYIAKQSKIWWQAQCAYRDLRTGGTVSVLQERIRGRIRRKDGNLVRIHEICRDVLAKEAKESWRRRNNELLPRPRSGEDGAAARTKQTARKVVRDWRPYFMDPTDMDGDSRGRSASSNDEDGSSSVLEDEDHHGEDSKDVPRPAARTKLFARKSVRPSKPVDLDQLVNEDSTSQDQTSDSEEENARQEDEDADDHVGKAPLDKTNPRKRTKQTARKNAPSRPLASSHNQHIVRKFKQSHWDITGDWDIDCEELSNFVPGPFAELTMSIAHDSARPGAYMADFDFNILEGIMRISCPKFKKSDIEVRTSYIYRGRETGMGEIQLGSDRRSYGIRFSDKGCGLKGEIEGVGVGLVSFTGVKVGKGSRREVLNSAAQWEEFSEEVYEEERVSRWR